MICVVYGPKNIRKNSILAGYIDSMQSRRRCCELLAEAGSMRRWTQAV